MAVPSHPAPGQGALRPRPAQGPGQPVHQPDMLAVGRPRPGVSVRARAGADRLDRGRADRPAVGRRGSDLPVAPHHLLDQLAVPLLRTPALRHRRRVAQPRMAGAAVAGRGVAQQPPCLPDLRRARAAMVGGGRVVVGHPGPRARGAGLGRGPSRTRAPGPQGAVARLSRRVRPAAASRTRPATPARKPPRVAEAPSLQAIGAADPGATESIRWTTWWWWSWGW